MHANGQKILIRTDAGPKIGIGHLMRCLTIARKWEEMGGDVSLLMSPLVEGIEAMITSQGFAPLLHDNEPGSIEDAQYTSKLFHDISASWLIADGYWFGTAFQQTLATTVDNTLYLDPLGAPQYNTARIIVNPNIYANEAYYAERAPHTRLLLGPKYLPLRPEFLNRSPTKRERCPVPSTLLISLGGGDPDNITGHILRFLEKVASPLNCIVVVGPANSHVSNLKSYAATSCMSITVHQSPNNMHELFEQADIAILAGGSTVWEALYMGVPTILMSYASNQLRVAPKLHELGYALYAGHFREAIPDQLGEHLHNLIHDHTRYAELSAHGIDLIDGKGIERIVNEMLTLQ